MNLRFFLPLLVALLGVSSCSTKKNTAQTRRWHAFSARYNTYFNGHEAYREGMKSKMQGIKDDYTERLYYFPEAVETNAKAGASSFDRTIEKCQKAIAQHSIKRRPAVNANKKLSEKEKLFLQRKEYNPFLKNAWLLMGIAQYEKGEFLEAAATFSYITRLYQAEPLVANEARAWLARCYVMQKWYYDAEDVIDKARRDTLNARTRLHIEATEADLNLRRGNEQAALERLKKLVKKEKYERQKSRLYFLEAQLERALGDNDAAFKSLQRVIRTSPPYEMQFAARIMQTELLSAASPAQGKKMISRLRRMARSDKNKEYLDQVYFAIGNIYLAQGDTAQAVSAYEKGREKATRGGVEKGVLLLQLGEIYWAQQRFDRAQPYYSEAIGLLSKERDGYAEAMRRSKVLDKLVPYTTSIHLQDSLLALSTMPEAERNAAIDRVINALKRKEAEERKARRDSLAAATAEQNAANAPNSPAQQTQRPATPTTSKEWYFYNVQLVQRGKDDFRSKWGNRKNEDNWRRSNRTVVADLQHEEFDYAAEDSLAAVQDSLDAQTLDADSVAAADAAAERAADPHNREYYLAQIPFTPEAKEAAHAVIEEALYNAGLIEKDDLEDYDLASATLQRLVKDYPESKNLPDVYYQLFLLYSRANRPAEAEVWRQRLAQAFPNDERTLLITDPQYEILAREGVEMEDELYMRTYDAYRERNNERVAQNYAESTRYFPSGANRPKFMFVHTLSRIGSVASDTLVLELRDLLKQFPESDVSAMAGMIVKGLESGRSIGTGSTDIGSLWSRRTAANAADSVAVAGKTLSAELAAPYLFLVAYPADSISDNVLLYEMAHFNFSTFTLKGLEMTFVRDGGITQFRTAGFTTYEEVHAYAQRVFADVRLRALLAQGHARCLLISEHNASLLGISVSYDDYNAFFQEHLAPTNVPSSQGIEELIPETHYEDEYPADTPSTPRRVEETDSDDEWY